MKGNFLRVIRAHRPAKSLPGIHGTLERYGLQCSLMAKVELYALRCIRQRKGSGSDIPDSFPIGF